MTDPARDDGIATGRRRLLRDAAAALGAALVGFATPAAPLLAAARRPAAIVALREWLPGRFVSAESGLEILPVYAPLTAPDAFLARELRRAGDEPFDFSDPADVLAQQLLAVSPAKRGRALLRVWRFAEPARWRDAHRAPDLFKGLMPGDVLPGPVIEVDWREPGVRLGARTGAAFAFELEAAAVTFRSRYERLGNGLP
jgi:hypothetical protein